MLNRTFFGGSHTCPEEPLPPRPEFQVAFVIKARLLVRPEHVLFNCIRPSRRVRPRAIHASRPVNVPVVFPLPAFAFPLSFGPSLTCRSVRVHALSASFVPDTERVDVWPPTAGGSDLGAAAIVWMEASAIRIAGCHKAPS